MQFVKYPITGFDASGNPTWGPVTVLATAPLTRTWDNGSTAPSSLPYYAPVFLGPLQRQHGDLQRRSRIVPECTWGSRLRQQYVPMAVDAGFRSADRPRQLRHEQLVRRQPGHGHRLEYLRRLQRRRLARLGPGQPVHAIQLGRPVHRPVRHAHWLPAQSSAPTALPATRSARS